MTMVFHAVDRVSVVSEYRGSLSEAPGLLNLLLSFPHVRRNIRAIRKLKQEGAIGQIFLDANTFARNPGGIWDGINEYPTYINIVKRYGREFDLIASYDLNFRKPSINRSFHLRMLRDLAGTGLEERLVPVIHRRYGACQEFKDYLRLGAMHIGIGSRPSLPESEWEGLQQLRKKYGVKIHQFGNLGQALLEKRYPDTADSGRYFRAAEWGDILFWNDAKKRVENVHVTTGMRQRHVDSLAKVFKDFTTDTSYRLLDWELKWSVNIYAIEKMAEWLAISRQQRLD